MLLRIDNIFTPKCNDALALIDIKCMGRTIRKWFFEKNKYLEACVVTKIFTCFSLVRGCQCSFLYEIKKEINETKTKQQNKKKHICNILEGSNWTNDAAQYVYIYSPIMLSHYLITITRPITP